MQRSVIAAIAMTAFAGAAAAQETPAADPVAVAVERVRADFNARLVDYDQRIQALEARVEALETARASAAAEDAAARGPEVPDTARPATPQ